MQIADQTVLANWKFYLLLFAITLVGTAAGSYLRARFTKRGEVAATKADAEEIIAHLTRTTEATKAVELALSHGDWIRREENMLKRTKLEALLVAAYSALTWTNDTTMSAMRGEPLGSMPPLNELEMLTTLYFPELASQSMTISQACRTAAIEMGPVRNEMLEIDAYIELAKRQSDTSRLTELTEKFKEANARHQPVMLKVVKDVTIAVNALATASRQVMASLTNTSPVQP